MITRLTRILVLFQIAIAFAVSLMAIRVFHVQSVALAAALGLGAVLLVRLLITANNFFMAWRYHSETPASLRLDWRRACRLFAGEFMATMGSSSWTMPFHRFNKRPAKHPAGLPVLLIHGYACNSGYWHSLSKVLAREHITHHAVDLEPVLAGIDDYVPLVQAAVDTLCDESGHDKVVIVAHSMGGIVARAYLRVQGSARVAKVITLGSPHRGTGLANHAIGLNSQQVRWIGSASNGAPCEWLRELEKTEDDERRALFLSIYSHHDNIISPQISSSMSGARNIAFHGIGHVALALDPVIQAQVVEEIHAVSRKYLTPAA
ncbi:MAG: alpha/beta fold hydrolase [Pseudomonadota bacterium]